LRINGRLALTAGTAPEPYDWPIAIHLLAKGAINIDEMITKKYPLTKWREVPCLSSLLSFPLISELFWIGFDHYLDFIAFHHFIKGFPPFSQWIFFRNHLIDIDRTFR
jgi:hypothetical protein